MMKKIVFSVLLCSSLFGLSACESNQEKREKLEAQLEHWQSKLDWCKTENECSEATKQVKEIREQLDKLNDIK